MQNENDASYRDPVVTAYFEEATVGRYTSGAAKYTVKVNISEFNINEITLAAFEETINYIKKEALEKLQEDHPYQTYHSFEFNIDTLWIGPELKLEQDLISRLYSNHDHLLKYTSNKSYNDYKNKIETVKQQPFYKSTGIAVTFTISIGLLGAGIASILGASIAASIGVAIAIYAIRAAGVLYYKKSSSDRPFSIAHYGKTINSFLDPPKSSDMPNQREQQTESPKQTINQPKGDINTRGKTGNSLKN